MMDISVSFVMRGVRRQSMTTLITSMYHVNKSKVGIDYHRLLHLIKMSHTCFCRICKTLSVLHI